MKCVPSDRRCYIVGADRLLISCAEKLLKNNFEVRGIFSSDPYIIAWCNKHKVKNYPTEKILSLDSMDSNFEYLFSILNPVILPERIIRLPLKYPINYHNTLLPKYAGRNGTSWSILNHEKRHGFTWHLVEDGIDTGDILFQKKLDVLPSDTSISLNIRCHELADKTFEEFLTRLVDGKIKPKKQNLAKRTYYFAHEMVKLNGFIDWNSTAESIFRLGRGLNFHDYDNTLTSPKFIIDAQVLIIEKMSPSDIESTCSPGTIVGIEANAVLVSTTTYDIRLESVCWYNGGPLTLQAMIEEFNITNGKSLYADVSKLENAAALSSKYITSEGFWVRQWKNFKPSDVLFSSMHDSKDGNLVNVEELDYGIYVDKLEALFKKNNINLDIKNFFILLISIYFYKHNQYSAISVMLESTAYGLELNNDNGGCYSNYVPLTVQLSPGDTLQTAAVKLVGLLSKLKKHQTYSAEIFQRYKKLKKTVDLPMIYIQCDGNDPVGFKHYNKANADTFFKIGLQQKTIEIKAPGNVGCSDVTYAKLIKHHIETLVNAVIENLHQPVKSLCLLNNDEQDKVLFEWSNVHSCAKVDESIVDLFAASLAKYPSKKAIIHNNQSISYKELDERSNQLARYLKSNGLVEHSAVCIIMGNQIEAIISILAVLKANCFYVPLLSGYPNRLLKYVLKDTKAHIILTSDEETSVRMRKLVALSTRIVHVVNYVASEAVISKESCNVLKTENELDEVASIMYTSGSTGMPKGIIVRQQSIIRLVVNPDYINLSADDNIAQSASIAFDASTFNIWGALLNGATSVLLDNKILLNAYALKDALITSKISVLWLTARLFDRLTNILPSMYNSLRYLLVGGDTLNSDRINNANYYLTHSDCTLLNGYGPSENTTFSVVYKVDKATYYRHSVPIGKPINNTVVYVLDKFQNPVPVGMVGELYVGGIGLAKGYLNMPKLTSEKFLDKVIFNNGVSTERLYNTGDLVCWLPDGNLDFVGRNDSQVKIRGFRVDLDVVQAYILEHDDIEECCIVAEVSEYGKNIVAFILVSSYCDKGRIQETLVKSLKSYIPEFMMPIHFVILNEIPLNQNGKINKEEIMLIKERFATPLIACSKQYKNHDMVRKLINTWSKVLRHNNIRMRDDFFDIGGDSINIGSVIFEVWKEFKINIEIAEFLKSPTIDFLYKCIEEKMAHYDELSITQQAGDLGLILKDMSYEVALDKNLGNERTSDKNILLTGSTGFLGAHILNQLLNNTDSTIYCLVREDSLPKFNNVFNGFSQWMPSFYSKMKKHVRVVVGDLDEVNLGLKNDDYQFLLTEITEVLHVAAIVNHIYDYQSIRQTNVESVKEIIKFSTTGRRKKINYISTLSAVMPLNRDMVILESWPQSIDELYALPDGYSQSKWVAEYLLRKALQAGLEVNIFRPGWMLGATDSGIYQKNNHLMSLIQSCVQLGVAPCWDCDLRFLPVDFVAKAIVEITSYGGASNIHNLTNINSVKWIDLITWFNDRGCDIKLITLKQWLENYLMKLPKDNALMPFVSLYLDETSNRFQHPDMTDNVVQNNTISILHELGIIYPKIDGDLLQSYFGSLIFEQSGMLEAA